MESSIGTYGEVGKRTTKDGRLVVGQMPIITMVAERERADGTAIGPRRPVLDMQPTIIPFADLLEALITANDAGRGVEFLGHVVVIPTDPSQRIVALDALNDGLVLGQ